MPFPSASFKCYILRYDISLSLTAAGVGAIAECVDASNFSVLYARDPGWCPRLAYVVLSCFRITYELN